MYRRRRSSLYSRVLLVQYTSHVLSRVVSHWWCDSIKEARWFSFHERAIISIRWASRRSATIVLWYVAENRSVFGLEYSGPKVARPIGVSSSAGWGSELKK